MDFRRLGRRINFWGAPRYSVVCSSVLCEDSILIAYAMLRIRVWDSRDNTLQRSLRYPPAHHSADERSVDIMNPVG